MNIRKGDTVKVLYGKDSGKTGKVLAVNRKERKVVVENVNLFKKHIKGDGQSRKSEIVVVNKPMPASKVMLVDPVSGKPTRVSRKRNGKKYERVAVRTGKVVGAEKKAVAKKSTSKSKSKKK